MAHLAMQDELRRGEQLLCKVAAGVLLLLHLVPQQDRPHLELGATKGEVPLELEVGLLVPAVAWAGRAYAPSDG